MGGKGNGHLVYKYTWSIGNCATWCNIPAPSSCHSFVAFKSLNKSHQDNKNAGPSVIILDPYQPTSFRHQTCLRSLATDPPNIIITPTTKIAIKKFLTNILTTNLGKPTKHKQWHSGLDTTQHSRIREAKPCDDVAVWMNLQTKLKDDFTCSQRMDG